jgi:ketosteroid isomerase-like protein
VRAAIDAWNREDFDAALEYVDPDIEWHNSGVLPGVDRSYHGRAGVRRFWDDWRGAWEELSLDVEKYVDLGEQVLALVHFRARGRGGIEVAQPFAQLYTFRAGKVVRFEGFADWDAALEAVGLSDRDAG